MFQDHKIQWEYFKFMISRVLKLELSFVLSTRTTLYGSTVQHKNTCIYIITFINNHCRYNDNISLTCVMIIIFVPDMGS